MGDSWENESFGVPPGFWTEMRAAKHRLLALDYDGTLAPFRVERMEARPLPGMMEALEKIHRDPATSLVIISGRPAGEVALLLDNFPVPIVGAHGYEYLDPGGNSEFRRPSGIQNELLKKAELAALDAGFGEHIELKAASIAVHTRGMESRDADSIKRKTNEIWEPLAGSGGMELLEFNGGVELRATGRDKGTILSGIRESMPEGTFTVYIGDDATDEDAFRYIRTDGAGIRVGGTMTDTDAAYRFQDPGDVLDFLNEWIEHAAVHDM